MYTLDTNAIIYYLQGQPDATPIVRGLLADTSLRIHVSTITEIELFGFPSLSEEEYREIDDLLEKLTLIHVDSQIARLAGTLRRAYRMDTPDSTIAATAIFTESTLVTRNVDDFKKNSQPAITSSLAPVKRKRTTITRRHRHAWNTDLSTKEKAEMYEDLLTLDAEDNISFCRHCSCGIRECAKITSWEARPLPTQA